MNFKRIKMMGLATLMMATVVGGTSAYANPEVGDNYKNDEETNIQSIDAVKKADGVIEAAISTDVELTIPQKNRFTLYVPTSIGFDDLSLGENTKDYVVSVQDNFESPVLGTKYVQLVAESDDILANLDDEGQLTYTCDKNGGKTRSISGRDLYFNSGDDKKVDWDFTASANITEDNYIDLPEGRYSDEVIFRARVVDSVSNSDAPTDAPTPTDAPAPTGE